jgi:predicted ATP-binding protein involved in virulence
LVDEVGKHLHIKLQKGIFPALLNLFPNMQFILSSHSPFLNMELAEVAKERTKIIDLNNFGISTDPTDNELYDEV